MRCRYRTMMFLALSLGGGLACQQGGDGLGSAGMGGPPVMRLDSVTPLPQPVDAVLQRNCRSCHSDPTRRYAPMPLVRWEDFVAPGSGERAIWELTEARINADKWPMPPVGMEMDELDRQLLNDWIADGLPTGE